MLMLILQRKKKESEEQQAGGSASARSKVVDDKDLLPPTSTIKITLMHSHRTRITRRLVKKKKKRYLRTPSEDLAGLVFKCTNTLIKNQHHVPLFKCIM